MNLWSIRPHYLLKIDVTAVALTSEQGDQDIRSSVLRELQDTKSVVVRRGVLTHHQVPIGIRGPKRCQRWAAWCPPSAIQRIVTPMDLLKQVETMNDWQFSPVRRALRSLVNSWHSLTDPWGPAGSFGFELATGKPTTTSRSDLDVVIYADEPLSRSEAQRLLVSTQDLNVTVDIRVETPVCDFSAEYVRSTGNTILLRTCAGLVLSDDPWDESLSCTSAAEEEHAA